MFGVNVCQRLVLRRCHAGTASENVLDIQGTLSGGRDPHRRQRWLSWFSGAKKPDRCGELAWYADLLSLCLDSQVSSKIVNPVEMWSGADLWGPEQQDWSPYVRVRARGEQEAQRQHAASWAPAASDWEALLSTLVFILLAPTTQIWAPVTSSTGLKDKANRTPPPQPMQAMKIWSCFPTWLPELSLRWEILCPNYTHIASSLQHPDSYFKSVVLLGHFPETQIRLFSVTVRKIPKCGRFVRQRRWYSTQFLRLDA